MEIRRFITHQNIEFEHCIGTRSEEVEMQKYPANFFSFKETEILIWIHVTQTENISAIFKEGLRAGYGHLGKGVYVCSIEHIESLKSFLEFTYNAYLEKPNADFSFIVGTYEGEHLYCVYGDSGHTGYCLIENDIPAESLVGSSKIEKADFLNLTVVSLRDLAERIIHDNVIF